MNMTRGWYTDDISATYLLELCLVNASIIATYNIMAMTLTWSDEVIKADP